MAALLKLSEGIPSAIPLTVGILATLLFLASYQQKKRKGIILFNTVSRILYILQYCMIGAFSGAALDVMGALSSVAAGKKESIPFAAKHRFAAMAAIDVAIVAVGLLLYENLFSLFPIVGVLLHTSAFWIEDERIIRRVSLLGSPFWLVYNLSCHAWGSAAGDVLTMLSILLAMLRYRQKSEL